MIFKVRFKAKRWHLWSVIKACETQVNPDIDKLSVARVDGVIIEIPQWSKKYVKIGRDWQAAIAANRKAQETLAQNKEAQE